MFRIFMLVCGLAILAAPLRADDSKKAEPAKSVQKPDADDPLDALFKSLKGEPGRSMRFHEVTAAVEAKLREKDEGTAFAKRMLKRLGEFELGSAFEKRAEAIAAEGKPVNAAELTLQCLRAKLTAKAMKRGGVAFGKVVVADGKLDTEWVLAQMPIFEGGYFAGEVGDMQKPIHFRAAGYEDASAPLDGKMGEVLDVGTVTLKPMAKEKAASVKGKVTLDIVDRGPATVSVSLMVPTPNTPHNGYSPRRRWPEPTKVALDKDGSFLAAGLTPGQYYLQVQAKDHANIAKMIKLEPGKEADQGALTLRTTDLGYYIGKPAPKSGELAWEKDYHAAMARAESEKKPVMVMLTATWCGPCKMLEKETLHDPWVQHFLSSFVIVQAFEDKDEDKKIHEKFGVHAYPTLVFTDSAGKEVHRTLGYQDSPAFLGQCVKAFKKLDIKLPEELQMLVEKKVVAGG